MFLSKALLRACLIAGQWLFVMTGCLAIVSVLADWLRSDATGRPDVMAGIGLGCFALAVVFALVRRVFDARQSGL